MQRTERENDCNRGCYDTASPGVDFMLRPALDFRIFSDFVCVVRKTGFHCISVHDYIMHLNRPNCELVFGLNP